MMPEEEQIRLALREVEDPEMGISIEELGLVYAVRFEQGDDGIRCEIDLTLTSPGCPVAPEIMAAAHRAILTVEGIEDAHVNLVWTPRWDPRIHASEDAKMDMGIW